RVLAAHGGERGEQLFVTAGALEQAGERALRRQLARRPGDRAFERSDRAVEVAGGFVQAREHGPLEVAAPARRPRALEPPQQRRQRAALGVRLDDAVDEVGNEVVAARGLRECRVVVRECAVRVARAVTSTAALGTRVEATLWIR